MDEHARVLGYRMTSQCASGSGQFLENIARYLGVTLEEIGGLSRQADKPEACSSICAVLAETDVINMVLVTGGRASDEGLLAAMRDAAVEQKAQLEICNHPQSILAGALGAALWGGFRFRRLSQQRGSAFGSAA